MATIESIHRTRTRLGIGLGLLLLVLLVATVRAQEETATNDVTTTVTTTTGGRTTLTGTQAVARTDLARRQQLADTEEATKSADRLALEWEAIADRVEEYRDLLPKAEDYENAHAQLLTGTTPAQPTTRVFVRDALGRPVSAPDGTGRILGYLNSLLTDVDFTDDQSTPLATMREVTSAARRFNARKQTLTPRVSNVGRDFTIENIRGLTPAMFKAERDALVNECSQFIEQARAKAEENRTKIAALRNFKNAIIAEIDKPRVEINELAIKLGLPLFCATVVILFCIPLVVRQFGSGQDTRAIFSSGILIEINTILLLTMSILILGLADKMKGEVLGTLLGGISGYVLNRIRERRSMPTDDTPPPDPPPPKANNQGGPPPAIADPDEGK